jgi:hypothetical protein
MMTASSVEFLMRKTWRVKLAVAFVAIIVVAMTLRGLFSTDRLRRNWKRHALPEISRFASDTPWLSARAIDVANQISRAPRQPGTWLSSNFAIMRSGESIIFRNECTHQHPLLGDIFIGQASDGRWYYSSYDFCRDMTALQLDEQPADLAAFIRRYSLREFDGQSDEAVKVTWTARADAIH